MLAKAYILLLEQPPRQSAHLPLGTNIRSGTHYDVHTVLLSQSAELGNVVLTGKVEHALALLVQVPEYVDADGIHAESLAHLDAVLPILTRNTWIMNLRRLNHKWLSVKKEGLVACHKRVLAVHLWG